jgi:hypothetical protein
MFCNFLYGFNHRSGRAVTALFNTANLPYWIFLGLGVALFLTIVLAGFDEEDGGDGDSGDLEGDNLFSEWMGWLGIGKAPLILVLGNLLSLWGLIGWTLNVVIGGILGFVPTQLVGWGGLVFGLSLAVSLWLNAQIARPLGTLFASIGEDVRSDRLIGCVGTVASTTIPYVQQAKIGQIDVVDPSRNRITVSATLPAWATVVPQRGDSVLIIDHQAQTYSVICKDSADEYRWLDASR